GAHANDLAKMQEDVHGGAESALTPEQQAISKANNRKMAEMFAKQLGVKRPEEVGNIGQTSESGSINLGGIKDAIDEGVEGLKNLFSDEKFRTQQMKMAGVSVPKTTTANREVGNQLTMFAQAEGVAEQVARSKATDVLGSHWKDASFDNNLGAVMVEDQLRTLKKTLLAAGKPDEAQAVNTVVGQPYSPIKSEAQYQQLKNSPEIKAAIQRHIDTVQKTAEEKQMALKGSLRQPGQGTGAFVNLIAKGVDEGTIKHGRSGDTMATLKKGSRFNKQFKGTGPECE